MNHDLLSKKIFRSVVDQGKGQMSLKLNVFRFFSVYEHYKIWNILHLKTDAPFFFFFLF